MTEVESELSTFTFFTRSMPPAATFEMRFPENEISENFLPVLTEIVATTIGISTKRMLDGTRMLK